MERQNYSLLEQTIDILMKKLMKISKFDIVVNSWLKYQKQLMKLSKIRFWQNYQIWWKSQIWWKCQIWCKCQIWRKHQTLHTTSSPTTSYCLFFGRVFFLYLYFFATIVYNRNGGGAGCLTTYAPPLTKTLVKVHTQHSVIGALHTATEGAAVVSVYIGAVLC